MVLVLAMVAFGGAVGALGRHAVSAWVHRRAGRAFPWGTLLVNVVGSFVLGCTLPPLAAQEALSPLRAFVTVGAIGAFTTFSTFSYEAARLLAERERRAAFAYVAASVGLGLLALTLGLGVAGLLTAAGG